MNCADGCGIPTRRKISLSAMAPKTAPARSVITSAIAARIFVLVDDTVDVSTHRYFDVVSGHRRGLIEVEDGETDRGHECQRRERCRHRPEPRGEEIGDRRLFDARTDCSLETRRRDAISLVAKLARIAAEAIEKSV